MKYKATFTNFRDKQKIDGSTIDFGITKFISRNLRFCVWQIYGQKRSLTWLPSQKFIVSTKRAYCITSRFLKCVLADTEKRGKCPVSSHPSNMCNSPTNWWKPQIPENLGGDHWKLWIVFNKHGGEFSDNHNIAPSFDTVGVKSSLPPKRSNKKTSLHDVVNSWFWFQVYNSRFYYV